MENAEEETITATLQVDKPNIILTTLFASHSEHDDSSSESCNEKHTDISIEPNDTYTNTHTDTSDNHSEVTDNQLLNIIPKEDTFKNEKRLVINETLFTQVTLPNVIYDIDERVEKEENENTELNFKGKKSEKEQFNEEETVKESQLKVEDLNVNDTVHCSVSDKAQSIPEESADLPGNTDADIAVQINSEVMNNVSSQAKANVDSKMSITNGSSDSPQKPDEFSQTQNLAKIDENAHTRNVSPRLVRKHAIRLPSNKRHSSTIMNEDILRAYDIIDRTDIKNLGASSAKNKVFSFNRLAYRLRRAFSGDGFDLAKKSEKVIPKSHKNLAVTLSLGRTDDGEQIQIITLGKDANSNKKDMTIFVNDFPSTNEVEEEQLEDLIESDDESDQSSINLDNESLNKVDVANIIEDDLSVVDGEKKMFVNDAALNSKKTRSSIIKSSKSFSTERARSPANEYFSTLPFISPSGDLKKLKKKTLNQEKFLMFTDGFPTDFPSFPSDRRSLIALEVYTTERTFVRGLEVVVMLFKRQMSENNLLDPKEMKIIFSNIESILKLNKEILDQLVDRMSNWSDEQQIADIFLNFENDFKIYSEFCTNYDASEAYLKQKQKKKKDFDNLLNSCYLNPVCLPGLTLPSYMITVIQRIPRYILLFKDLLKRTALDHKDYQNISKVVKVMEKVASYLNEQLKQSQCAKALEALQTQITGLKAYFTPDRNLVHEGYVSLLSSKKTYQCVLFNDLLVFAIKGANKQSSVEHALDLKTVWIEDLLDLDPQTTKNDAIAIYTPDRPYTMYVGKSGEKSIWIKQLKLAIARILYDINATESSELEKRETSYTYVNGSVYSGTFEKAKRHGEGTMMWPNQMTYRGEWLDDERNGFGVLEYLNGDTYEGQWMDDKQDGLGTLKYKNGDTLSGEWKHGFRDGQIAINYVNGDKFVGQSGNDRIEGFGELTCTNGFHYTGQWKRNLKHGKGKLVTPEGAEYSGYFLRGKFQGNGELIYPDGSFYKGEFERGERCGMGKYTLPGQSIYEGQWMHDLKDGHGKMTYENGDEYDGTWVSDMRIGQGVMFYNYGGYYRGQWQSDLKHGNGLMEFCDGRSYDGEWFNGVMSGSGTMKFKHGDLYKGSWKDNQANGKGILTKPGGWYCDGLWTQGKQNGYCRLKDATNQYEYCGNWLNGLKEGHGVETSRVVIFEGEFVDDLRDGFGKETFPDGTIYEGYWSQGQKHGNGSRKLNNGVTERQIWTHGCLTKSPVLLSSRDMPTLQRFL